MAFDLSHPNRTIHAGVILTKGITEMLDVAPFEFFAWIDKPALQMLNLPEDMVAEALDIKLHWVTEDGRAAEMKSKAKIEPTDSFATCPPLDIVLMGARDIRHKISDAEKQFIKQSYDNCSVFITICGGIFDLLEIGVLTGKTVAVPRMTFEFVKKAMPHVNWVDKRWVNDGKIWSSNSLLNGTDLMRAFAEQTWGGRSGMIEAVLDSGHYPARDVNFADFHGKHFDIEGF